MSNIPYIIDANGHIAAFVNGQQYSVGRDHPNYEKIVDALKNDDADEFGRLQNIPKSVVDWTGQNVEIKDGVVYYQDEPIHNTLTDRILQMMNEKLPCEGMLKFLENLMKNPSGRSIKELYTFLENKNLPITSDGCFLAYKSIRDNWTDWYSGKVDNSIGSKPRMPRNKVDDDFERDCSYGFHVGALDYVSSFHADDGKQVVVKVDPKDVVSVPKYAGFTKMRVCSYEVVEEYTGPLNYAAYEATVSSVKPMTSFNFDDDYDEEDEDEDYDLGDEDQFGAPSW